MGMGYSMPTNQEENKNENLANTDFISEKIKQRPINRKKLLRRTIITVTLAVLFGFVACLTFLLLQPLFSDKLYPEKEPDPVTLPQESASDELTPEEMFADDDQIAASEAQSFEESQKEQIDQAIASYSFDSSDYNKMVRSLKSVTDAVKPSLVSVTALSNDTNWFSDSYESSGSTSGLIVADNGTNLFILVPSTAVSGAETIRVTFCDGATANADLCLMDSITKLGVICVKRAALTQDTRNTIGPADLGSSAGGNLTGSPVIALGSPVGVQDSVSYGIITSEKSSINLVDTNYRLLTTDIYGSASATGILINLHGQVIGIIDMSHNQSDMSNQISAIGITELKGLIEDLSNQKDRAFLGIHGATVPSDIQESLGIPAGAYVTQTEMSSPAMRAGIQSGDIITSFGGSPIDTYEHLVSKLAGCEPNDIITITVMRQAPNEYIDIEIEVTLSASTTDK